MTFRPIQSKSNRANPAAAPVAEATNTPPAQTLRAAQSNFNYPVIEHGSKIGIHSMQPSVMLANIRELKNRGGRFPVVKAVSDMDWLMDVKAIDPNIITIGRFAFNRNGIGEGLNGIHEVTNDDFSIYIDTMFEPLTEKLAIRPELRQAVDYWEICNEPDPPGSHGYRNLSLAMIGAIERANSMGLKLGIFALNAGTPEWYEMETMVETGVFAHAKAGGHIMTLHEGVFRHPTDGWLSPVDQWFGDPIPANESNSRWVQLRDDGLFFFDHEQGTERPDWWATSNGGPLCFRYRYLYELLKQRDQVIPLVVSEIVYGEGYGEGGSSVNELVNRASWYDRKAAEDYYIWAHLPFTFGGGGTRWENRNYDFGIGGIVDYNAAQKDRPNATAPTGSVVTPPTTPTEPFKVFMPIISRAQPPTPTPVPPSTPVPSPTPPLPEVNRQIRVNLIPKNATLNERLYTIAQTHASRENLVQSAMDARNLATIGNDSSVVKAWASNRWSTSIVDFMNQQGVRTEQYNIPNQEVGWTISPWEDPSPIVVNLMPQDTTLAEKSEVAAAVHNRREAMMQAEQDSVDFVKIGPAGSKLVVWSPERWPADIIAWLNERGVPYEIKAFGSRRSNRVFID